MIVPVALQHRQDLFGLCGVVDHEQYGVYESVCIGQGLIPQRYDFKINQYSSENIAKYLQKIRMDIITAVQHMPSAKYYIEKIVAAGAVMMQEGRR
mgnify:FL=1